MKAALFGSLAALSVLAFGLPAGAHALLMNPVPLIPEDDAKSGPCGCYFGAGPEDPGDDGSPVACPGDYQVTTLQAGQPMMLEWLETVNHAGDFRIAFSPKPPPAVTKADMDAGEIITVPDENPTSGAKLTQMITVPNEPCELCTIQLRQFMMGAGQPYYYTCAAVKIVGGDSSSSTTTSASTAASGGGEGGGESGQGASSGDGGGGGPSTGAGMANPDPKIAAGCSAAPASAAGSGSLAIAGLSLIAGLSRRRRRGSARH